MLRSGKNINPVTVAVLEVEGISQLVYFYSTNQDIGCLVLLLQVCPS